MFDVKKHLRAVFSWDKFKLQWSILAIFLTLISLFIIGSPKTFLSLRIYTAVMSTAPYAGIMALGLAFIIMMGEIDLSFPSTMALGGFIFTVAFESTGNPLLALVAALIAGSMAGAMNGLAVTRIGVPSIVITIGALFFWRGVVLVGSEGISTTFTGLDNAIITQVFAGEIGGIPTQFLWAVLLVVVLWVLLNRHRFGNNLRFVGDNEDAARMMGINVNRTKILAFSLLGLLAALSGVISNLEMLNWWPTQGKGHFLPVFAIVFLGGTNIKGGEGTVFGTFIGMLIIGTLEAGIVASGISGFWTRLVMGVIIVIAIIAYTIMRR